MKAIDSFKGQIVYAGKDSEQPADLCLKSQSKQIYIEVKDTNSSNDLWGSKQGHIGDQLVALLDEFSESFIIVLGSYDECLKEVPQFTRQGDHTKWAGKCHQESNKTTLRALNADAYGSGIPVFYLSKDRVLSFKEALSYGKNRLLGANPFQWSSPCRGKAGKIKALMGARGIGAKNAEALLLHFGSIKNIALAGYEDLKGCPGIGPERAVAVMEMMK
jgi:ERCC4-type nuclease